MVLTDGRGYRGIAHVSRGTVSHQTMRRIISREAKHVRISTLEAIADACSVEPYELIELADDGTVTPGPWVLPSEFDDVPSDLRESIERMIRDLVTHLNGVGVQTGQTRSRDHAAQS
jgi:DNA-binding Xre family transcriptional regulator